MLSRFQMAKGTYALLKRKNMIDHRLQFVLRDGLVHLRENSARSDVDAADRKTLVQDVANLDLTRNT